MLNLSTPKLHFCVMRYSIKLSQLYCSMGTSSTTYVIIKFFWVFNLSCKGRAPGPTGEPCLDVSRLWQQASGTKQLDSPCDFSHFRTKYQITIDLNVPKKDKKINTSIGIRQVWKIWGISIMTIVPFIVGLHRHRLGQIETLCVNRCTHHIWKGVVGCQYYCMARLTMCFFVLQQLSHSIC